MQRTSIFIIICIILLSIPAKVLLAKDNILTKIDSIESCPDASFSFPILVSNLKDVDSLRLVLNFDPTVIEYKSYYLLNTALLINATMNGAFTINANGGELTIDWYVKDTSVTLVGDTLIMLNFKGYTGNSPLSWDITPGACLYRNNALNITYPSQFVDGYVRIDAPIQLKLKQMQETCTGKCDAGYSASISGGTPPYQILWNNKPGFYDTIQIKLCDGANQIEIKDAKGCSLDSTYQIPGMPGPKVELKMYCENDTTSYLYRENPILTFRVESDEAITPPLIWEFGDGDTAVSNEDHITHVYSRANTPELDHYTLKLHVTNSNKCDTVIEMKINIKDNKIRINNVLVPTGTDRNRVFTIADADDPDWNPLVHQFRYIEVVIFDRWGRRLYSSNDYQSDWKADGCTDGVYFYNMKVVGAFNTQVFKGSITVIGSGK